MPIVRNPTGFNLYCDVADEEIPAQGEIEVTDEVAARVSRCVFIVEEAVAASATPKRATRTRGAKAVETTEAPEVETR